MTTKKLWAAFTPRRRLRLRRAVGLLLLGVLSWQIARTDGWRDWWPSLRAAAADPGRLLYLSAAILLMPINWMLETEKWRTLLAGAWPVSRWTTFKAVLGGISVSLVTPNRIGEYGGRALLAPAARTIDVVYTSVLGSICQWLVFLACGWPALWLTLADYYAWGAPLRYGVAAGLPVVLLLLIAVGYTRRFITLSNTFVASHRWGRWLRRKLKGRPRVSRRRLLTAFTWALLRFWVYSFQYLALLWFFGISLGFGRGMRGIFSIYLIQAGIPLPPGFSVITRSELALFAWRPAELDPLAIVSATFSLYLINLLLPALLGALLIVKKDKNQTVKTPD